MLIAARLRSIRRPWAQVKVLGNRHGFEKTLDFSILGHVDNPVPNRRRRNPIANRLPVKSHLAAVEEVALDDACNDLGRFSPAGADKPNMPVIWPAKIENELFLTAAPMDSSER